MNALIIRSGALGDTLMLLPALAHLAGKASITLVGRLPGIDFLRSFVDHCMNFESGGWHTLFRDSPESGYEPPVSGMDMVVAFSAESGPVLQENLQRFFPASTVRVSPPFPPQSSEVHVALYLARCLQEAGLPLDPPAVLASAQKSPLLVPEIMRGQKRCIVLHPGSGSPLKNYSPDFWSELLKALKQAVHPNHDKLSLLLGPAEEDNRPFYERLGEKAAAEVLCSPEREALLSLLGKASLYIGLDSGVSHLAAMCGTPSLVLFKYTPVSQWLPSQWLPIGPRVRVLTGDKGDRSLVEHTLLEAVILTGHIRPPTVPVKGLPGAD